MGERRKVWTASSAANIGLVVAGLAAGPMVTVNDAGSFADALILALAIAALIIFVAGVLSLLLKRPMRRPTMAAPVYESGEFIQQSFLSGLILCAMALGGVILALATGSGQGWRLFAAIGTGCLLGSMVSSWLFAARDAAGR